MRDIFEATIERLLGDMVTPELLRSCESGEWPADLWRAVEESGFSLAAAPEEQGGSGASWADVFVIVRAAGRFNLPLPLPETLLGNALLGQCGLEAVNGPLGISAKGELTIYRGRVSGTLIDVPWGRHVKRVVAITSEVEPQVVVLDTTGVTCVHRLNTAGEPRDDLSFENTIPLVSVPLPAHIPAHVLKLGGALMRSAQIAGALQEVLHLTTRYATERVQFGKTIGSFQALQQQIAILSEHTGAANVAAECAFTESKDAAGGFSTMAVASAKICSAEAAGFAASVAHTVHGAIGFTHEYALHHSTRRLWSWRSEFGNATSWSQILGQAVCQSGATAFWPAVTLGHSGLVDKLMGAVK